MHFQMQQSLIRSKQLELRGFTFDSNAARKTSGTRVPSLAEHSKYVTAPMSFANCFPSFVYIMFQVGSLTQIFTVLCSVWKKLLTGRANQWPHSGSTLLFIMPFCNSILSVLDIWGAFLSRHSATLMGCQQYLMHWMYVCKKNPISTMFLDCSKQTE